MPDLFSVENRIIEELKKDQALQKRGYVIALDGSCASGKSTLAFLLQKKLNACLVHVDDFYFPRTQPRQATEGNSDLRRILEEVLIPFKKTGKYSYQPFDPVTQSFQDPVEEEGQLLILEGTYSLHPLLREFENLRVFLDEQKEIRLSRLQKRNPENMNDFLQLWIPAEERYFDHYKPWETAHLTFFPKEGAKSLRSDKDLVQYIYTKEVPMSDKSVILGDQAQLVLLQAQNAEEVIDHLIKVQSIIDVVANSLESKNADNKLDIASELNSLVAAYDQLECAQSDISQVAAALNELVAEDNKNA